MFGPAQPQIVCYLCYFLSTLQASDCPACEFTSCLCMSATPAITPDTQHVQREATDQAIPRLPTYSQTFLTNQQQDTVEYQPIAYSPPDSDQARIVNTAQEYQPYPSTEYRQCWANPYQAEVPGCSVQRYRGGWYNICR